MVVQSWGVMSETLSLTGWGDAVVAPVTEVLGEVCSELVVVGFEPGDLVEGSLEALSQRLG